MSAFSDWALRRLLKFVLKRNFKHLLRTELDLDQLSVQLGRGTLELRDVLLNTDYLNEQLVGGVGRVGGERGARTGLAAPPLRACDEHL